MNSIDTFLFDLDGTLVDSIPDLATSVNLLRAELGLPSLTVDQVRASVGDGVGLLVQRSLPPELFTPDRRTRFMEIYAERLTDLTRPYPGIVPFLERHRSRPMAVITNKPQTLAEIIVTRLDLARYFPVVIGAEAGLMRKPHPDMVISALSRLGANPAQAVVLGDHHVDLRAARAAGVKACFCAWGLGHEDGLSAEYRAEHPEQLADLFPGARP